MHNLKHKNYGHTVMSLLLSLLLGVQIAGLLPQWRAHWLMHRFLLYQSVRVIIFQITAILKTMLSSVVCLYHLGSLSLLSSLSSVVTTQGE